MAKHGRKRNNNAIYARAYAHITGVLCFLLSQVSHKHYNPLCNNHLHWFQKQLPTLSHFHAATLPQKNPKTPSSKQLFDLQSKTTHHFPQNDTLFSVKRHVVFYKTTRRFWDDEVFSIPSTVTLVTAKNKTRRTGARIHTRVRTPSANPQPSPHPIKPTHPLLHSSESPFIKTFTYEEIFISNETTNNKS